MITKEGKIEKTNPKKKGQKMKTPKMPLENAKIKDTPVLQVKNKKKFRKISENRKLADENIKKQNAKDILVFQKKKLKLTKISLF